MKRSAKLCIILVLALLFLAACGEKKSPWQVDYDFFWDTLEENYPYAAAIERINGKSLAEVREKYAPAADEAQSAEELYRVLNDCMSEFPKFTGHFGILGEGMYQTYMDIIACSPGQGKYEFMKKSLDTQQSRAFYGYKEPVAEGGEVESRKVTGNLNIRYIPTPQGPSPYVAYASVAQMLADWQSKDTEMWDSFWARIEEKGYQDCIIDIRGNGGGSDTYWGRNIIMPNIDGAYEVSHVALVRGKKSVAYLEKSFGEKLSPVSSLDVKKLSGLNPADLALATHYTEFDFGMSKTGGTPAYTGRIWLLVDERVYSASEKLAIFCKDTGFATIVGTPTGGDGIGIDPLAFALPNSGIAFRFSAMQGLNLDGSCNEEFGTTPDILCKPGEDALELCLDIIKEQGGETK